MEAAKLYYTAIAHCQRNDEDQLLTLYEAYAYECYLTNQVKQAISYQGKALGIYEQRKDLVKTGDCMRFLSRLWWFDGNRKQAEIYGNQAVDVLHNQPSSRAKAMAFSNMSQLKMLSNEPEPAIYWGGKAITIAKEIGDKEVECHALNNIGTVQIQLPAFTHKGRVLLRESLAIALERDYHEHAARAYTNLGSTALAIKDFAFAEQFLNEGIDYCTKLELGSWAEYMSSQMARVYLETGRWKEAADLAMPILEKDNSSAIIKIGAQIVIATIKLRRGEPGALPLLLEAKIKAFDAGELQRVIPVMIALLEYEWLTGLPIIEDDAIEEGLEMVKEKATVFESNELAYWLCKAKRKPLGLPAIIDGYHISSPRSAQKSAACWEKRDAPYMRAQSLFAGTEDDKREAISLIRAMGATAAYERMKQEMRASGIKSIPRGKRGSTLANAAFLTGRELDVLKLLQQGLNNKEIASKLFISPKTVDHHISSILTKLNASSRAKAVKEAMRMAILE